MFNAYVYEWRQSSGTLQGPTCFFSNVAVDQRQKINAATLKLTENSAGSLEFDITSNNVAADKFQTMSSIVVIKKDGGSTPFWIGRMMSEERDMYDRRHIACEGALNFLMDTIQRPKHIKCGILSWLQYLFTLDYHDPDAPAGQTAPCHNTMVGTAQYKQVVIKYFDPSIELEETVDWYANYETTLDLLKNVIEAYNLKMEVTYENMKVNLSFYSTYPDNLQSDQVIMFGRNLINYTRSWSLEDFATVVIPTGKTFKADDEERPTNPYTPPDLDAVVTIESVNNGSIELSADTDIINRYGRIVKKVSWNDIEEPANLLDLAQHYFSEYQWDKLTLTVELYDLSLLMTGAEKALNELKLLGTVRCVSRPHGLDKYFPITEVTYDFNNPGKTQFVLGALDGNSTISGTVSSSTAELKGEIEKNKFPESRIYNEVIARAFDDATALMNNYANTGYVSFTKNPNDGSQLTGIVIADNVNWSAATTKLWMWNQGGLAWSEDGGRTFTGVAITNDGKISANFITAGTLNANIIRAGTLQDVTGNTAWNLETGVLKSKDFTLETVSPNIPGTDGYLYLSNKTWRTGSAFSDGTNTTTVADVAAYDWKMIVGTHFGVTEGGELAINKGHIGGIGVGDGYLRTESITLGNNGSFYMGSDDSSTAVPTEGTSAVAGTSRGDWRLTIANCFGVTSSGVLYSQDGHFTSADVQGNLRSNSVSTTSLQGNGSRSLSLGTNTAAERGTTQLRRRIVVRVKSFQITAQNYVQVTVEAFVMSADADLGTQLDGPTTVHFYTGAWHATPTNANWYEAPVTYHVDSFFKAHSVTKEITVTGSNTISNPATMTYQGYWNAQTSPWNNSACFLKENEEATNKTAFPLETSPSDVQANGWSDSIYVYYNPGGTVHEAIVCNSSFVPSSTSHILGDIRRPWKQVYYSSLEIVSSSRNNKYDITSIPDNFDIFFDNLQTRKFRLKIDESRRQHLGFIVDEVGTALNVSDIPSDDFAGYEVFNQNDPLGSGGLRYGEFIALNTWQIQKAKKKISELEERIEALERNGNE